MLRTLPGSLFSSASLAALMLASGNLYGQGGGTEKGPDLRTHVRSADCSWAIQFGLRFIGPNEDPNDAPQYPLVALLKY